jgi:hypothetical protein
LFQTFPAKNVSRGQGIEKKRKGKEKRGCHAGRELASRGGDNLLRVEMEALRKLLSRRAFLVVALLFCALSPFVALADEDDHEYQQGDVIPFLVNTIGPYANPSEIYSYYSLPVCAPPKEQRSPDRTFNLGESLEGDEFKKSLYVLKFKGINITSPS